MSGRRGTIGVLVAHQLRRDRIQAPIWVAATAILAWSAVIGVEQSYGSDAQRAALLQTVAVNPVILLFRGLPSGAESAAFALFLILPWLTMLAALAGLLLAVRHTRAEEESGRGLLIGAAPVGRLSEVTATLIAGCIVQAAVGLAVAGVFMVCGLPPRGSWVAGAATSGVGIVFLAVGLCSAQLARSARGARSIAVWLMLITFVISGIGNALGVPSKDLTRIESSGLVWASPFGWAEQTRPFDADASGPLLLCLLVSTVLVALALALRQARDQDEGMLPQLPGRSHAPASLSSMPGLAWRLSRGSLLGWMIGGFLTGLLSTGMGAAVRAAGNEIPAVQELLRSLVGRADVEAGMVVIFYVVVGVLAACWAVQSMCRARQEEVHGTRELVAAPPLDRVAWLGAFAVNAAAGVVLVCAAALLGSVAGALSADATRLIPDAAVAALGQILAALVFIGVTGIVFVLIPRATIPLSWSLVLVALGAGLFAPLFRAPDWVSRLSPFAVAPIADGGGIDARGAWWLLAAAVLSAGLALGFMRRRELASD
ncbi:ABC transporter permease [Leucobacter luti]|uniref:ABC transporter permease n=1 Tax=Leucobacter luti TaxID=340320 RepID=UPI003CFC380D